jgi:hypothetical protein
MKIKGEEYFVSENPGFVWKGATALYSAIVIGTWKIMELLQLICLMFFSKMDHLFF